MVNGIQKVRTLDFLSRDMTLGQAALKWLLAEPTVVTTLPNIYDAEQLAEFAAARKHSALVQALERTTRAFSNLLSVYRVRNRDTFINTIHSALNLGAREVIGVDYHFRAMLPSMSSRRAISRQTSSGRTPAEAQSTVRL